MKYILKSSKEIFITYILSYLIILITSLIYYLLGFASVDNFINNVSPYILIIFYIITIVFLYQKNYRKEIPLRVKNYFPLILLGISIAVFLNMLIFIITNPNIESSNNIILTIISTGIIGPIYEEILFRYLLYNRLTKKYTSKKAILITTTIFALIHLEPIKLLYAFILGLIININYKKYKNILSAILIHVSANIIVIFLTEYNPYILILSLINLIIYFILTHTQKIKKFKKVL